MKAKIINLLLGCMGLVWFSGCEIHDPIAEISTPGYFAANVYWDVPNTVVPAGSEVPFYGEYWTVGDEFQYVGVWYDVVRTIKYSLTYAGNGYTFAFDSLGLAREFQEIAAFEHNAGWYDPEKKAYALEAAFPVSYTLSGIEVVNPLTFNQSQFSQQFPQKIVDQFFDGLFTTLAYADLKQLLVVNHALIEEAEFETHYSTVTDPDTGLESKVINAESVDILKGLLKQVPLQDLLYNSSRQFFGYEFIRVYELNARLRVVNGNGVEQFSESKKINVN